MGLFSYVLVFNDNEQLKVDFNYYPFPRIHKGMKFKNLEVDSVYDIAVNKVQTMLTRIRSRDFIDLYFIMKTLNYSLEQLIKDARNRFDWNVDRVTLASQFARVKDTTELPTILIAFDRKDMEQFYLNLIKSLNGEIFK